MRAIRTAEPSNAGLKQISCKGRNGYFQFGAASIWRSQLGGRPDEIFVQIYSKHPGEHAPIQFSGPSENMMHLFAELTHMVRDELKEIKGIS